MANERGEREEEMANVREERGGRKECEFGISLTIIQLLLSHKQLVSNQEW